MLLATGALLAVFILHCISNFTTDLRNQIVTFKSELCALMASSTGGREEAAYAFCAIAYV
jgi:hypothetical protein